MPRWIWFVPVAALAVAVGLWAFRLGWIAATLTETDVILAYTAKYLDTHGTTARATDCSGQPADIAAVWIVVTCIAQDETRYDYPVDRFGQLILLDAQPAAPEEPKT
ncbi:MAG: hypothetical protein WBV78_04405 [Roseobacter sp.]